MQQVRWVVRIDPQICEGCLRCVMETPSVFELEESTGKAIVTQAEPDDTLRTSVDRAVRGCPVHAISIKPE